MRVTKTRTRSQRHLQRSQTSQYRDQASVMLLVPHHLRLVEVLSVEDAVDGEALLAAMEVRTTPTSSVATEWNSPQRSCEMVSDSI